MLWKFGLLHICLCKGVTEKGDQMESIYEHIFSRLLQLVPTTNNWMILIVISSDPSTFSQVLCAHIGLLIPSHSPLHTFINDRFKWLTVVLSTGCQQSPWTALLLLWLVLYLSVLSIFLDFSCEPSMVFLPLRIMQYLLVFYDIQSQQ